MSNAQHTSGPWIWGEDFDGLANARLIAAAPELLEALRAYVREHQNLLEGHSTTPTLMADAEAAIQKAIGESA